MKTGNVRIGNVRIGEAEFGNVDINRIGTITFLTINNQRLFV